MSRRPGKPSPSQAAVARLCPLDGARIPGGCDQCHAYQTVTPITSGVWILNVHHDDWCPFLRRLERRAAR
jgi:hypothetical protein